MAERPSAKTIQARLRAAQRAKQRSADRELTAATASALPILISGEDEAGGSASGTGTGDLGGPQIDLSLFGFTSAAEVLLMELIREGEAKLGRTPATKDPSKQWRGSEPGQGPQRHPLLRGFEGVDPKLTIPSSNPEARENFNRLANELRPGMKPQQTPKATPV